MKLSNSLQIMKTPFPIVKKKKASEADKYRLERGVDLSDGATLANEAT